MSKTRSSRLGNVTAVARVLRSLPAADSDSLRQKRRMLADFCRLVGAPYSRPPAEAIAGLSPRHVQTLQRLLVGDSEKQIAARLGVSRNTVHCYVTGLYRHFDVSTRAELLARFVRLPGGAPAPSPV